MKQKDKYIISLEVSSEIREMLRTEAFKRAVSISELIRQLILQELGDNNGNK